MISDSEAIARIETELPGLAELLHDEINEGLLHLQIAEFSRLAQETIDDGDKSRWKGICELFRFLFLNGSPDLVNALNVSFLEHLNFPTGSASGRGPTMQCLN